MSAARSCRASTRSSASAACRARRIGGVDRGAGVSRHDALRASSPRCWPSSAVAMLPSLLEAPPPPPGEPAEPAAALAGPRRPEPARRLLLHQRRRDGRLDAGLSGRRCSAAGPGVAAAGYAVFSAAMTIGRLSGDWLTIRVGRVRIVRTGRPPRGGRPVGRAALGTLPAALVGFVCVGAGFSVAVPLVFSAAGRLDSRSAGPGLAAVTTAGYLGFLAGPPIIGFVAAGVHAAARLGDCRAAGPRRRGARRIRRRPAIHARLSRCHRAGRLWRSPSR